MTSTDVSAAARSDRAAAAQDAEDAFEEAVRPHYANLVRRLVLVVGDPHDAEDVAQDAYLKAYRSWDRFDGVDVRAWLYTIALRLAFNQLRGRRRWLAALDRIEPPTWSDPSDPDLAAALGTLDVRTRAGSHAVGPSCATNSADGPAAAVSRGMPADLGPPTGTVVWDAPAESAIRYVRRKTTMIVAPT